MLKDSTEGEVIKTRVRGERQRRGGTMLRFWEVGKFQGWITGALQADSVWGGRVCLDKKA